MLQDVKRTQEDKAAVETVLQPDEAVAREPADYDDGLLATGLPIMVTAYAVALAIAAFTFIGSGDALFVIAICVGYGAMFFGVPVVMARMRNGRDTRWQKNAPERVAERVAIFSGTIRRPEAVMQIVIVPVGVAAAFAAFSVIWLSIQP